MAVKPGPVLAAAVMLAAFLSGKKKAKSNELPPGPSPSPFPYPEPQPGPDPEPDDGDLEPPPIDYKELISAWESINGLAEFGKFYQIKYGDTLLAIAREALFGSRAPRSKAWEVDATVAMSIRIDCSPWNQAVYSRTKEYLDAGHYAIDNGLTDRGISFMPRFVDNRSRLASGQAPSSDKGDWFAYIWIPMIDRDVFMNSGVVTLKGQNWPSDDDGGEVYSMIQPPPWVIDLNYKSIATQNVGCNLPEGDYREILVKE